MSPTVLDANAVIMHGQAFPQRVKARFEDGERIILPAAVKRELVDDVLENDDAPENHRRSARSIEGLIEEGYLTVRSPDFETYGAVVDEARRRIADDSLPEHAVQADQYIPALVCELAEHGTVQQFQGGAPGLKERGLPTGRKHEASRPGRKPTFHDTNTRQ